MTSSNIDAVIGYLNDFAHSINMRRPGREGSLGKDLAMTIIRGPDSGATGGIMGRIAQEVTPDGSPWPANDPGYAAEKEKKYGWDETNRRTGQMTSQESLYGRTTIEPEVVTLRYGTGQPPSSSRAPTGYMSKSDRATTDEAKAMHAHSAGRGFYGLGAGDGENVTKVAQENVNELIVATNAANGV
jgi:hypothetical protein